MEEPCEAAAEAARALFFLHSSPALMPAKAADCLVGFATSQPAALRLPAQAGTAADAADESDDTESGYGSAPRRLFSKVRLDDRDASSGSAAPRKAVAPAKGVPPRRPRSRRIMLRKSRRDAALYEEEMKNDFDDEQSTPAAGTEEEEEEDDHREKRELLEGDSAQDEDAMSISPDNNDEEDDDDDDEFAETRSEPPGLASSPNTALAALLNLNRAVPYATSSSAAAAFAAAQGAAFNGRGAQGNIDSLLQGASMLADLPAPQPRRGRSSSVAVVEKHFSREAMPLMRVGKVGAYAPDERKRLIDKFLRKREKRIWRKRVKYNVRKNFADSRLRVKGRFVRKEDEEQLRELLVLSF